MEKGADGMASHPQAHGSPEPNVYGSCLYCGNVEGPMVHRYESGGRIRRPRRIDELACTAWQDREAEWAESRWAVTPAGSGAAHLIEVGTQLRFLEEAS
jgi:hypothetical protein